MESLFLSRVPYQVALVAAITAGCLSSKTVPCEGGEPVCPAGFQCIDYECVVGGICGNAKLEPGEVCDLGDGVDGNGPGSGCAFNCQSDESCGNGFLDAIKGESCDDVIDVRRDGCDTCSLELPYWRLWTRPPSSATKVAAGHDYRRGRSLLFDGVDVRGASRTLEWSGNTWNLVDTDVNPPPGRYYGLVYDAARDQLVMGTEDGDRVELWAFSRGVWSLVDDGASGPIGRKDYALAYDHEREVIVLFGGYIPMAFVSSNHTWEWDGQTWTQPTPATSPPLRTQHTMAYDPVNRRTVLYGGIDVNAVSLADTWLWDGTEWEAGDTGPTLSSTSMTFDARRGRVVLIGTNASDELEVYELDGALWSNVFGASPPLLLDPGEGALGSSFFDTTEQAVVIPFSRGLELHRLDVIGAEFSKPIRPIAVPENTSERVYDPLRGAIFAFNTTSRQVRQRVEGTWPVVSVDEGPTERKSSAMAFDRQRGSLLVFGGFGSGEYKSDTWLLTADGWIELSPTTTPPPRSEHGLFCAPDSDRLLLYGGQSADGPLDDLWSWDGSDWELVSASTGIGARLGVAAACDPRTKVAVVFGGRDRFKTPEDGAVTFGDTWLWDGERWQELELTVSPPSRAYAGFTYEPNRRRFVLHGGSDATDAVLGDTWEFSVEDTAWTIAGVAERSPSLFRHRIAFDAIRSELVTSIVYLTLGSFTYTRGYSGPQQDRCDFGDDGDSDGLIGCEDRDCWGACTPFCPPGSIENWNDAWPEGCDSSRPHCGDGACNRAIENLWNCPADCTKVAACGDFECDPGESNASCPGDCPS